MATRGTEHEAAVAKAKLDSFAQQFSMTDTLPPKQLRNTDCPIVHVKDGAVYANSRDVAAFFGKEHKNVLRDVDILILRRSNLSHEWFQELSEPNP